MNRPTCEDVAPLIDLFAAGECGPGEEKAVRAHVPACPACRAALDEARQLQGLLDIQFGQPAALEWLSKKLKADPRRGGASVPWLLPLRQFAAVAALLLVAMGLALFLPSAVPQAPVMLQMGLYEPPEESPRRPGPPPPGPPPGVIEMARDSLGPEAMAMAKRTGKWPLPPRANLGVVVSNRGRTPIELKLGGSGFLCEVELSGPGQVRRHEVDRAKYVPFRPRTEKIAPGKSLKLRIGRLASQRGQRVWYLYPTAPGEYEARVRLEAEARSGGEWEKVRLKAPPRKVPLP